MSHFTLKNILCIEEDERLARLLQMRLQQQRFSVDIVTSAEEGINYVKKGGYDLVLLDYDLPRMNGLKVLDSILPFPDPPPVIVLVSPGSERAAVSALEKGAADYAVKDGGNHYLDALPAIVRAACTKALLLRENERQRQELAAMAERAEAVEMARSNFLTTMSHEIRTPLNVVTGLTAVLARTKLDAEQKKMVQMLSSNADLLLKLVNDMLDVSGIGGGHVVLDSMRFEFSSVLQDIKAVFEEQAKQKNIAFHCTDDTQGRYYLGDRARVEQILMNLVSNAIKFTEKGAVEINISLVKHESDSPCIKMSVKDTGTGMQASELAKILEKFNQRDETIMLHYGGSGLGLSIACSLSKMMHGMLTVESELGKGSAFSAVICLKACEAENEIISAAYLGPQVQSSGGLILLVEDYAPNIMVATMMLEDLGYEVLAANSGEKAIAIVSEQSRPFNAIMMDVQMQEMDGLEATRRIRQLEQQKGFRNVIIGVTAHALAGDRERCISAGMDDYISKPIHPDILASKLQNLCLNQ